MRGRTLGLLVAVATAGAALSGCGSGASSATATALRGTITPPAGEMGRAAPGFALTDGADGRPFGTADLAGRPYLVTFLYTHCSDACPLIAAEVESALRLLGRDAARVSALAVSVDPRGDTRAAVLRFLAAHHEPENFHYLIGSPTRLAAVWRRYYVGAEPADGGRRLHTASVWLVDARGRWEGQIEGGIPISPAELAFDLRHLLRS
jgi:protein SCO1/2